MFKKIPGNTEFLIDIFGNIKPEDGKRECAPVIFNKQVCIEMYGKNRMVDVDWLGLIAHFEVNLPPGMEERIFDINFVDTDLARKSSTNKMMVFKKPIIFKEKYRIVPNFTNYAVSQIGEVVDTANGEVLTRDVTDVFTYPSVWIYNPEIQKVSGFVIHRLVASAWVYNRDYFYRPIVNHIDGDKTNFHYQNLEWVSYSENSLHAVNSGLRNDNMPCLVFDIKDKSVREFPSIKQACQYMGIGLDSKITNLAFRTKHKLINGRFQMKLKSDTSEWFYEKHELGTVAGRYFIHVEYPDGTVEEHPDVRTFKKVFGVWNTSGMEQLMDRAEQLHPGVKFSYTDNYVMKPVQAYKVATGEIFEEDGIRQMARRLGMDYSYIRTALLAGETRVYEGYAFRYKTDAVWNKDFAEFKCRSKRILATHQETHEEIRFDSERAVARHFSLDRGVVRKLIRAKQTYQGFTLEHVDQ